MTDNKKNIENSKNEEAVIVKPDNVPVKFWNQEKGEIRIDELLKSYSELEKNFSKLKNEKDEASVLNLALKTDVPASDYNITIRHKMLSIDKDLNERLKKAGFSNEQAQLVYDLGAEIMMPMIENMMEEFRLYRELEKLEKHFGGEERFDEISRQIIMWAEKNIPEKLFNSLNTSYYGVIALYNMMNNNNEPSLMNIPRENQEVLNEKKLKSMMSDPRYWRDGDKDFIKKVDDGFKILFDKF